MGGFLIGFLENNGAQFMATLILSGAIIGSCQWVTLRWAGMGRWLFWPLASGRGWIASTILVSTLPLDTTALVARFGLWEVFWLNLINQPLWILGMAAIQGVMLPYSRQRPTRTLVLWLLASCLGAATHGAVSAIFCRLYCQILPQALVGIVEGLGWGAYGKITGMAMIWIVSHTDQSET